MQEDYKYHDIDKVFSSSVFRFNMFLLALISELSFPHLGKVNVSPFLVPKLPHILHTFDVYAGFIVEDALRAVEDGKCKYAGVLKLPGLYTIEKNEFKHIEVQNLNLIPQDYCMAEKKENERLELLVEEKTKELNATMCELINKEKLASLGGLIAGISHEINTPLGVVVSATSCLSMKHNEFVTLINSGKLTKDALMKYLNDTEDTINILLTNITKSSELIKSLKQVSID